MFTVSVVLVALVQRVPPSPSSLLRVSHPTRIDQPDANQQLADAKQARDLVQVLSESKQQIDPRLSEMARYGGGGGGGRGWGGRGRGGHGRGGGHGRFSRH